MPGSQLKRLKASLREQNIIGPQQSKKQRRKNAQDERAKGEKRLQRGVVLEGIREQFNPFDLKHATRGPKFEVTTNRPATSSIKGRPGAAKAASEERRRQTLLVDMQRRNKVGGILDKRFGEGDATMNEEDKAIERFVREKQKSHKKMSMFDLEDEGEPIEALTHGGEALDFNEDKAMRDDFDEDDLGNDSDDSERGQQRMKRLRAMANAEEDDTEQPERKKTKKEVMEEVIAKSKFHKMERQAAKDEDDDLRGELDKELPDLQRLLRAGKKRATEDTGPSGIIAGVHREKFERDFDVQIKKLAQDKRAQPSDRTKTDEEKAEEDSKRLRELEDKRQRRMRGEEVTDSEESSDDGKSKKKQGAGDGDDDDDFDDEEDTFGLGAGLKARPTATELGFDDEDDFIIDDDLVASGSDMAEEEWSGMEDELEEESANGDEEDDDDDDFTKGLLNEEETRNPVFDKTIPSDPDLLKKGDDRGLPFTFTMPTTFKELKSVFQPYPQEHIPTIVQRIRALYHPKLDSQNKERLAKFSVLLVDFIASPWSSESSPPFSVLESLIRHIHSLSKSYPTEVSHQFRSHLEKIGSSRPLALLPEDLLLLTAVGSIFPASDHFHQVVTPATLTMARYLGQKVPQDLPSFATGVYLSILALQGQQLSKRYLPEVMNFSLNTLCAIAPNAPAPELGRFPLHEITAAGGAAEVRLKKANKIQIRKLTLSDCLAQDLSEAERASLQTCILDTTLSVLDAAADTWSGKEAFTETFDQVTQVLQHLLKPENRKNLLPQAIQERSEKLITKLERMTRLSQLSRRPLQLHHHRPLAIKTYIPKFEETYDPDKHYDPDRDRAELAKLRADHKRERKGAMRELRKDASFVAREKLRAKKAKDEAYEKKYKRLVAEIQSEEGRESNAYEREKSARKRARDT